MVRPGEEVLCRVEELACQHDPRALSNTQRLGSKALWDLRCDRETGCKCRKETAGLKISALYVKGHFCVKYCIGWITVSDSKGIFLFFFHNFISDHSSFKFISSPHCPNFPKSRCSRILSPIRYGLPLTFHFPTVTDVNTLFRNTLPMWLHCRSQWILLSSG